MPDLIARSGQNEHWRKALPATPVTLGRRDDKSHWATPWDKQISGQHATLEWKEGALHVQRIPSAVNPIFYRGTPTDDFKVAVGEKFVIGGTTFEVRESERTVAEDLPTPNFELTCSRQELQQVKFSDADQRIEVLSALPAVIRHSPSDEELETHVVDVLLKGIPRADAAAVVWLDPSVADHEVQINIRRFSGRMGIGNDFQPSRRLILSAVRNKRQSVLHKWYGGGGPSQSAYTYTAGGFDWAICTPLPDEPSPGWALYVTGKLHEGLLGSNTPSQAMHTSDLKFSELVAQIFGSLRQVSDLQRRHTMLARFLSRPVLAAVAEKDIAEVLKPRQTDVAVLFCDLRGSCRIAEEGEEELALVCDRMSEALRIMTSNIIDKDGVIGDFHGDAAMGFWGWPIDTNDSVEQAARAALAIRRDFARAAQQPGHPLHGFACGIGIAYGPAIAGRLGTEDQFKISVFGPIVNLAARLESLTKRFQVSILLDETAASHLASVRISHWARTRRLARIQPMGMKKTLLVSELLPTAVEPGSLREQDRRDFEAALDAFLQGDWRDSRRLLERLAADGPTAFLKQFMDKHAGQPPAEWDGVVVMEEK